MRPVWELWNYNWGFRAVAKNFYAGVPTADHSGGGAHAGFMGGPSVSEVPKIWTFLLKTQRINWFLQYRMRATVNCKQ